MSEEELIKEIENLKYELQQEKEKNKELELDLEEMTKSNEHKKEHWVHKAVLNSYINKDKIRQLKSEIHQILDKNGITRGYQLIVDREFEKIMEEEE